LLVDGIHDLGGMQGFGAVAHSPAEPVFQHRWEAAARALMQVVAGAAGLAAASSGTRSSGWSRATT
jgi:nitrile hydratase